MKVSIHISHTSQDDLGNLVSRAQELGFAKVSQNEFLGLAHTELRHEMDLSALEQLIIGAAQTAKQSHLLG